MMIFLGVLFFMLHIAGSYILILLGWALKKWIEKFEEKKIIYRMLNLFFLIFSGITVLIIIVSIIYIHIDYPLIDLRKEYRGFIPLYGAVVALIIVYSPLDKVLSKIQNNVPSRRPIRLRR